MPNLFSFGFYDFSTKLALKCCQNIQFSPRRKKLDAVDRADKCSLFPGSVPTSVEYRENAGRHKRSHPRRRSRGATDTTAKNVAEDVPPGPGQYVRQTPTDVRDGKGDERRGGKTRDPNHDFIGSDCNNAIIEFIGRTEGPEDVYK